MACTLENTKHWWNKALNKWKDIPHSWITRLTVKMAKVSKLVCRFNVIPIKPPMALYCRNGKADPKIHMGL